MTEKRSFRSCRTWGNRATSSHREGSRRWIRYEPQIIVGKVTPVQTEKHRPTHARVPDAGRSDPAHAGSSASGAPRTPGYHADSPDVPPRAAGLRGPQLTVGVHQFEAGAVARPSAETWRLVGASVAWT